MLFLIVLTHVLNLQFRCDRQLQRTRASCNALDEAQRSYGAGLECQRKLWSGLFVAQVKCGAGPGNGCSQNAHSGIIIKCH